MLSQCQPLNRRASTSDPATGSDRMPVVKSDVTRPALVDHRSSRDAVTSVLRYRKTGPTRTSGYPGSTGGLACSCATDEGDVAGQRSGNLAPVGKFNACTREELHVRDPFWPGSGVPALGLRPCPTYRRSR